MSLVAYPLPREIFVAALHPGSVCDLLRTPAPPQLVERTLLVLRSIGQSMPAMGGKSAGIDVDTAATAPDIEIISPSTTSPERQPKDTLNDEAPNEGAHEPPPEASISMEELVREHADAVYRVALSVTRDPTLAEDASQDALIKAWQALPSYRGDAPLRHWILRITHNVAISLLRRRREDVTAPADLPDVIVAAHSVESQVQDRLALELFNQALQDLDPLSRSIVVLREVEGLSYNEIGDVLEVPLPTVRTRLLRARRQLAVALDGWQPG